MSNQYTSKESNSITRFWNKVNKNGSIPTHMPHLGQCWEWTGGLPRNGRPQWIFNGRIQAVSRVSWQIINAPITDGLLVLHKCDNPKCVNPLHLFLGTHQDNMDDMKAKGRQLKGHNSHNAIITKEDVLEIRRLHKEMEYTRKQLSQQFKITVSSVRDILLRRTWKHI